MQERLIINETEDKTAIQIKSEPKIPDVQTESNFLSKLFFFWAFQALKYLKQNTLQKDNLGYLNKDIKSETYMKSLHSIWKKTKKGLLCTTINANLCILS
jgi:hypothetical protein